MAYASVITYAYCDYDRRYHMVKLDSFGNLLYDFGSLVPQSVTLNPNIFQIDPIASSDKIIG